MGALSTAARSAALERALVSLYSFRTGTRCPALGHNRGRVFADPLRL